MTVQNLRHSYLLLAFLIQRRKLFGVTPNTGWFIGRKIKAKKDALPAAHFPLPASTKTELQWVEIDYKFPTCVAPGLYLWFIRWILFLMLHGIPILTRINWFSRFLLWKYPRNFWSCRVCPTMPLSSSRLSTGVLLSRISSCAKHVSLHLGTSIQQNASQGVISRSLSITSAGCYLAVRGRCLFSASADLKDQAGKLTLSPSKAVPCVLPLLCGTGSIKFERLKEINEQKKGTAVLLTYIRAMYITWQGSSPGWWIHLLPWLFWFFTGHDCQLLQESMNWASLLARGLSVCPVTPQPCPTQRGGKANLLLTAAETRSKLH